MTPKLPLYNDKVFVQLRISRIAMTPMRGCFRRDLLNPRSGQMRHEKKQQEIGRYVKVEIHQHMNQESRARDYAGELQGARKGMIKLPQPQQGLAQEYRQEPSAADSSQQTCFRQRLQIVVVGMVDNLSVVKRFIGWIYDLKRAEARAPNGMVQEDMPRALPHGSSFSLRHLK